MQSYTSVNATNSKMQMKEQDKKGVLVKNNSKHLA